MDDLNMKRLFYPISLIFIALVSGCASLPDSKVKLVGKRRIECAVVKHGAGTVVFENGLGGTMNWWAKVMPDISKETTTFAYNRPGYAKSDPVSAPRDGAHIVDDLRSFLRSEGLKPPYVLVGHSLGGLYMQFFARRYPGEVSALVLVDSTHPTQFEGQGSPENWPAWFRLLFRTVIPSVARDEFDAIDVTGQSVLSLPTFTGKPVIVLSASKPLGETSALAKFANEKRRDIARLYPGSKQIWVDSGHVIPLEKPEAVVAAIRSVLPLRPSPVSGFLLR